MADRIMEGLWDCPYCGEKGIGGLTKSCPNCAHPQDAGTKFYLGEKKTLLDDEKAKNYGKGADWTCAYCGSLNRYDLTNCRNCGAERADSSGDYFDNRRKEAQQNQPQPQTPKKKRPVGKILLVVLLAVIALFVFLGRSRKDSGKILDKYWERSIALEAYTAVEETDWSVPEDAAVIGTRQAVRYYESVLDHYETESYEVGEEVLDGYDTEIDYVDNGDGTFREVTTDVPRYRTEYHTETRKVAVYRDEPVYDTQYTYVVQRWLPSRTEHAQGCVGTPTKEFNSTEWPDAEPYWPDTRMSDNERESARAEAYYFYVESRKGETRAVKVDQSLWDAYKAGDSIEISVNGYGEIVSIAGVAVY